MKRLIKRTLRAIWELAGPIRRPIARRMEQFIARSVPDRHACHVSAETGLLMDLMVRELVRLQKQVDQVQQALEELTPARTGLAVVGRESEAG